MQCLVRIGETNTNWKSVLCLFLCLLFVGLNAHLRFAAGSTRDGSTWARRPNPVSPEIVRRAQTNRPATNTRSAGIWIPRERTSNWPRIWPFERTQTDVSRTPRGWCPESMTANGRDSLRNLGSLGVGFRLTYRDFQKHSFDRCPAVLASINN